MTLNCDTLSRGLGMDSSRYISPSFAAWMMANTPIRFVMRYMRRVKQIDDEPREKWPVYLSRRELQGLLQAGLRVGLVQTFVGRDMLTREDGLAAGEALAWNAQQIGADPRVSTFGDFEWGAERSKEANQAAYIDGHTQGQVDGGAQSVAGYVGSNTGLDGDEWYALPRITRYWKALSQVPTVSKRGWCLVQSMEHVILGQGPESWSIVPKRRENESLGKRVDLNVACQDSRGGRVMAICP